MEYLNSTRKQLELSEILEKNSIDILWFGKPRCKETKNSNLKKGEGGVGFLIREGLREVIDVIHDAE